ncbi:hypothetical protein GCM10010297_12610 [Streptomyces malachitofuscus]|nr:hypothetical protein GCM10010297_12610 [Streptomyces malachitofuscus]
MGHADPSHLVELALGHVSGAADVSALRHVASCPRCRGELVWLTRVVTAARGAEASDLPVTPPEHVWRHIAREVLQESDGLPRHREHPARRSADTRTREALLALAGAAAVLLVRWLWIRAGRVPHRWPGRRLRPPW